MLRRGGLGTFWPVPPRRPLEKILPLMTSNPAKILKLRSKGMLAVGKDADIIMLSSTNLKLRSVITRVRLGGLT